MHFVLLLLATVFAEQDFQQDERLKKFLEVKPSSRFRPIHMLEELPERPVPKLADFMGLSTDSSKTQLATDEDDFFSS